VIVCPEFSVVLNFFWSYSETLEELVLYLLMKMPNSEAAEKSNNGGHDPGSRSIISKW
jgi:hypothetical protein